MGYKAEDIRQVVNELRDRLIDYKLIGQIASSHLVSTKQQIEKSKREQTTIHEKMLQTRTRYDNLKKY